jgi:hypothetical protein
MTDAVTAVDKAVAAALEAAKTAQPPAPSVPAMSQTPGAVAPVGRAAPLTLQDFNTSGLNVEEFLKVNAYGITFGKDQTLFKSVIVDLDMSKVQVCHAIKFGNPATYFKTYDGVSCASGGTWAAAVQKAQNADPKARPYDSADLTFTNTGPLQLKEKVIPAGTTLGHSLSTTNRQHFADLISQIQRAGYASTSKVRVELGHEHKNKGSNNWGLVTFKLIGLAEEQQPQAKAA